MSEVKFLVEAKRHVKQLPTECAAYIAGLIDGEGTITLTRLHASENRRLVVSIANTEFQLLKFVIDRVGAGKITRKRTTSDRHAPSYCYAISSRICNPTNGNARNWLSRNTSHSLLATANTPMIECPIAADSNGPFSR